jgi:hypothetical protein
VSENGHKVTAATGACHERSTECYRPYAPLHQCMAGSTAIVTLLLLNTVPSEPVT